MTQTDARLHACGREESGCRRDSANIAARILGKEIVTRLDSRNPDVPPTAEIEGIDLVTEGVLTLGGCLKLLKKYVNDEFDAEFFDELDADNGASRLAKLLIEECTELNLFVGTAVNAAHQETELNFDLSMRQNLVDQLIRTAEAMGKTVKAVYTDTGYRWNRLLTGLPMKPGQRAEIIAVSSHRVQQFIQYCGVGGGGLCSRTMAPGWIRLVRISRASSRAGCAS